MESWKVKDTLPKLLQTKQRRKTEKKKKMKLEDQFR